MKNKLIMLISLLFLHMNWAQQIKATYYNEDGPYYNVGEDCVAVQGYDLVAYHKEGKAMKGSWDHQFTYDDIHYYFASATNKELFVADPLKYIPAYGGYCAYGLGMPNGKGPPGKYPINPESFKIVEDRLYLFYDDPSFQALPLWNRSEQRLKNVADIRWKQMTTEQ